MWASFGRKPWVKRAKRAGKVFFWARSPLAPRTTMTVSSVKASPDASMDGIEPFFEASDEDMTGLKCGMKVMNGSLKEKVNERCR